MKEYDLKLTQEEVQIVGTALLELPAKISMQLIGKINEQLSKQLETEKE